MKLRIAILAVLISFTTPVLAEYYVVLETNPCAFHAFGPIKKYSPYYRQKLHCCKNKAHIMHKVVKRHHVAAKSKRCYAPDLATGDDNPCIYPDLNIDR